MIKIKLLVRSAVFKYILFIVLSQSLFNTTPNITLVAKEGIHHIYESLISFFYEPFPEVPIT